MATRRELDLKTLDQVGEEVQRLASNGCQQAGEWNLAQTCWHLRQTMDYSLNGFPFKAPWLVRKLIAPMLKRKLFASRNIKAGLAAPAQLIPSADLDQDQQVQKFQEMLGRVKTHSGDFASNPFFEQMPADQWHDFHTIHSSHHLS